MNDQQIEQEIQAKGLTAPRVTPDHIESVIDKECYFTAADAFRFSWITSDFNDTEVRENQRRICESLSGRSYSGACIDIDANAKLPKSLSLLTFCVLILKNGFTVTGESACASPKNFDAEIGRKIARENAVNKIWLLEGYLLKQKLSEQIQPTA